MNKKNSLVRMIENTTKPDPTIMLEMLIGELLDSEFGDILTFEGSLVIKVIDILIGRGATFPIDIVRDNDGINILGFPSKCKKNLLEMYEL